MCFEISAGALPLWQKPAKTNWTKFFWGGGGPDDGIGGGIVYVNLWNKFPGSRWSMVVLGNLSLL